MNVAYRLSRSSGRAAWIAVVLCAFGFWTGNVLGEGFCQFCDKTIPLPPCAESSGTAGYCTTLADGCFTGNCIAPAGTATFGVCRFRKLTPIYLTLLQYCMAGSCPSGSCSDGGGNCRCSTRGGCN